MGTQTETPIETPTEKLLRLRKRCAFLERVAEERLISADRATMAACGATAFEVLNAAALPELVALSALLERLEETWLELAALEESPAMADAITDERAQQ